MWNVYTLYMSVLTMYKAMVLINCSHISGEVIVIVTFGSSGTLIWKHKLFMF